MHTTTSLTATEAREFAKRILAECSECFTNVKAVKQFGKWIIKINGGREACYGKTIETMDGAEEVLRVFAN